MEMETNDTKKNSDTISQHEHCETQAVKWMCLKNIYEKFQRPNFYDIGGTYAGEIPEYWFSFKTETVADIFLLHLFVASRISDKFTCAVSQNKDMEFEKKNIVRLPSKLKEFTIEACNKTIPNYICTYSFSDIEVDMLSEKTLYIAVEFPLKISNKSILNEFANDVKLNHDFRSLFNDPINSDFVIESADGVQWKVHKLLLKAHSEVFKAMLKEDTAESQQNYVKLVDCQSADLGYLIEFIYTGTIKHISDANFANLLMLADQYDLKGLRELSENFMCQNLDLDNVLETLVFADMCNSGKLKIACFNLIKKNPSLIQSSTFEEIKNVALVRELCKCICK